MRGRTKSRNEEINQGLTRRDLKEESRSKERRGKGEKGRRVKKEREVNGEISDDLSLFLSHSLLFSPLPLRLLEMSLITNTENGERGGRRARERWMGGVFWPSLPLLQTHSLKQFLGIPQGEEPSLIIASLFPFTLPRSLYPFQRPTVCVRV